jgi:hypothetical protein
MHKVLQVADYFQMRQLTLDIEDCLINHIQEEFEAESIDPNHLMELVLWSESYDLKCFWSTFKEGFIRSEARSKLILVHLDFNKLSHPFQIDFMKSILLSPKSAGRL